MLSRRIVDRAGELLLYFGGVALLCFIFFIQPYFDFAQYWYADERIATQR